MIIKNLVLMHCYFPINNVCFILILSLPLFLSLTINQINAQSYDSIDEKISEVKIDKDPFDIAVNPDTNKIYVTHSGSDTVSVIDGEISQINATIPIGSISDNIAVNPDTNKIYVTHSGSDTVSVINGSTDKSYTTIPVGREPFDIAVSPDTNKIYVANSDSDTVSVINGSTDKLYATIPVDGSPRDIAVNPDTNKIYVIFMNSEKLCVIEETNENTKCSYNKQYYDAFSININHLTNTIYVTNSNSDTVSVINGSTDKLYATIPVDGSPRDIAVNPDTNTIYVANSESGTVSVINGSTDELVTTIPLGNSPQNLAVNPDTNKIYVTHSGSNSDTVSVIDGEISQINATIPIGKKSRDIAVNPNTNTIYVTHYDSNNILLIDEKIDKVILSRNIIFNVSPSNSGRINCDGKEIITNQSLSDQDIILPFGSKCIAEANDGFKFNTWVENIGKNSIRTINASSFKSDSPFSSFFEYLGFRSSDEASIFTITESRSGSFTANFKEVPPPIPSEYLVGLYTIVATTIVGWSIPSIIGWIKSKRETRKLNHYHRRITSLYDDSKLDENDLEPIDKLRSNIADSYSKGKINNEHYANLKDEISVLYQQIYNKKLDSLKNLFSFAEKRKLLQKIKNDIADSYSKGNIKELHYNMLKEKILEFEQDK